MEYGFAELRDEPAEVVEPRVESLDDDDTNRELWHILLIAHSLIGGKKDVEPRRSMTKAIAILQACPTFLLNRSDREPDRSRRSCLGTFSSSRTRLTRSERAECLRSPLETPRPAHG